MPAPTSWTTPSPDHPALPETRWKDPGACLCCRTEIQPGTIHWWQVDTCRVEVDRAPRFLVAQRTIHLQIPRIADAPPEA